MLIDNKSLMNIIGITQQIQPVENSPVSGRSGSNSVCFKDILDNTISKPTGSDLKPKSADIANKSGQIDEKQETVGVKPTVTRFRDIAAATDQNKSAADSISEKSVFSGGGRIEDSLNETANAENNDNPEGKEIDIISAIAMVIGLQPSELKKLFDYLGIDAEKVSEVTDTKVITDKITGALQLNMDQKQVLISLFELVAKQMDSAVESGDDYNVKMENGMDTKSKDTPLPEKAGTEINGAKVENLQEAFKKIEVSVELKPQIPVIKIKIHELLNKLQEAALTKSGAVQNSEIPLVVSQETPLSQTPAQDTVKTSLENTSKPEADSKGDNVKTNEENGIPNSEKSVIAVKKEGNTKVDFEVKASSVETDVKQADVKQTDIKQTDIKQADVKQADDVNFIINPGNPTTGQNQKADANEALYTVQKELPVPKNEIMNQVIEKAKITLTGEKAEMIVNLKPDNLGKLAMKIVTEHGIVTAKFVAENQQVKQILESNMQMLKDTLEKQGLVVQGFTVSVGQGNSGRPNGEGYASQGGGRKGKTINVMPARTVYTTDLNGRTNGMYGRLTSN